jgi:hypothetical protein
MQSRTERATVPLIHMDKDTRLQGAPFTQGRIDRCDVPVSQHASTIEFPVCVVPLRIACAALTHIS